MIAEARAVTEGFGQTGVARAPVGRLFVILLLFILAPYLNAGITVNGGLLALLLLFLFAPSAVRDVTRQSWFYRYSLLFLALGAYSGFVASLYGQGDLSFLKVMISLCIYIGVGFAIGRDLVQRGISGSRAITLLMKIALAIVVLNSVIVIVSFLSPAFKNIIESLLAEASNIDYKASDFKLRGIASAGGAGLSVMHGVGAWIALALYKRRQIGIVTLALSSFAIAAAMLFIGRTGFVLIGLSLLMYVLTTNSPRKLGQLLLVAIVLGGCVALIWSLVEEMLPPEIQKYSILFLFQGSEGLQQEGTVGTLSNEIFVPESLIHVFFGIGYYNGDNILGKTSDPGYMKSMLSLGAPLAAVLYAAVLWFLLPMLRNREAGPYMIPITLLLFISEIKEPFLYSGYAARLLFMMGGVWLAFEAVSSATAAGSTQRPAC